MGQSSNGQCVEGVKRVLVLGTDVDVIDKGF